MKQLLLSALVMLAIASCGGDSGSADTTTASGTDDTPGVDDSSGSSSTGSTDSGADGSTESGEADATGTDDSGTSDNTDSSTAASGSDIGFMVLVATGITEPSQLDLASLCFVASPDTQVTIEQFLVDNNLTYELVSSSASVVVPVEYTTGRCDAVLGTLTTLEEIISNTDDPGANQIIRFATDATGEADESGESDNPDDTNVGDNASRLTGIFVDSAVEGLDYNTPSAAGTTNASGEFSYVEGESVTFSIGALSLPSVVAGPQLSPFELARGNPYNIATAVNMARLLQSLDVDGNPENGIEIVASAASSATPLNFSVSVEDFENNANVINLVANSGSAITSLADVQAALSHLNQTVGITYNSGDIEAGRNKAAVCIACHGTTSGSGSVYENLAGLSPLYITAMLDAYATRATSPSVEEQGPDTAIMTPMASSLTEQDMVDIAAYYSSLD